MVHNIWTANNRKTFHIAYQVYRPDLRGGVVSLEVTECPQMVLCVFGQGKRVYWARNPEFDSNQIVAFLMRCSCVPPPLFVCVRVFRGEFVSVALAVLKLCLCRLDWP